MIPLIFDGLKLFKLMIYLYILFFSLAILLTLHKVSDFVKIGSEIPSNEKRKIHSTKVVRVGGLVFLSLIIIYPLILNDTIRGVLLFSYLISLIGFSEDLFNKISEYLRLLLLILLTIFFVYLHNFTIHEFDNYYINRIVNSIEFISYFFVVLGLLFAINGFNFIDGLNGLMLGFSLIVLSIFSFYCFGVSDTLFLLCTSLFLCCLCLFIINFFTGRILTGDGGAYFLGFLIGSISVVICNEKILNASTIAFIICYPIIEMCFSFLRRLALKGTSSFRPDNLHIHQLLYYIIYDISKKRKFNFSPEKVNSISSLLILITILFILIIGLSLKEYVNSFTFFIGSILIYCYFYYRLIVRYQKLIE